MTSVIASIRIARFRSFSYILFVLCSAAVFGISISAISLDFDWKFGNVHTAIALPSALFVLAMLILDRVRPNGVCSRPAAEISWLAILSALYTVATVGVWRTDETKNDPDYDLCRPFCPRPPPPYTGIAKCPRTGRVCLILDTMKALWVICCIILFGSLTIIVSYTLYHSCNGRTYVLRTGLSRSDPFAQPLPPPTSFLMPALSRPELSHPQSPQTPGSPVVLSDLESPPTSADGLAPTAPPPTSINSSEPVQNERPPSWEESEARRLELSSAGIEAVTADIPTNGQNPGQHSDDELDTSRGKDQTSVSR